MAVNITDFISFFFLFSFGIPFVRRPDTNEKHRNDIPLSNDTFSVPKLVFVCMRFFQLQFRCALMPLMKVAMVGWCWCWCTLQNALCVSYCVSVCVLSIIIIPKTKSVDNLQGIVIQSGQPLLIKHCPSIMYQKKRNRMSEEFSKKENGNKPSFSIWGG